MREGLRTMSDFEYTFIVEPISEELEDELLDEFDCLPGTDHSGRSYITITTPGANAVDAAKNMHMLLLARGIHVQRAEHDLVTRSEIADRLQKTRQAVGNWIRGTRQSSTESFPETFNDTAGGVWLWGDVVSWVRQLGIDPAPGFDFPTREDLDSINACIHSRYGNQHLKAPFTFRLDFVDSEVQPSVLFGLWKHHFSHERDWGFVVRETDDPGVKHDVLDML